MLMTIIYIRWSPRNLNSFLAQWRGFANPSRSPTYHHIALIILALLNLTDCISLMIFVPFYYLYLSYDFYSFLYDFIQKFLIQQGCNKLDPLIISPNYLSLFDKIYKKLKMMP